MKNKEEIIINDTPAPKVKKPLTEAQKAVKQEKMRIYYAKMKTEPEYIERQRLSSRTHYYKHKEEVIARMKKYQQNKLELARIGALHDLQKERAIDLTTGDCSQEDYGLESAQSSRSRRHRVD